jgi:membrane protein
LVAATHATVPVEPLAIGVSVFTLLWSSLGVFLTVGYAFDRAWAVKGDRNIVLQYFIAAALTLAVGAAIIAGSLADSAASMAGAGGLGAIAAEAVVVWAALVVLYRAVPNATVNWRECLLPAAAATLVCGLARAGFAWYLSTVANVGRTYGPMAGVAGLMLWLFVTSAVVLWGAELSHNLARASRRV